MTKGQAYWAICWLLAVVLAAFPLRAEDGAEEAASESAADVAMDDGSAPGGDLVIPKALAMRCGISSKDAGDKSKIKECLDKVAVDANDITEIQFLVMDQLTQNALEQALQIKAEAGDYEDSLDKKLGDDSGVQAGSPAAGGEAAADGEDLRAAQTKNVKISSRSAVNITKLIDIYSTRVGLNFMEMYFSADAPRRRAEQTE